MVYICPAPVHPNQRGKLKAKSEEFSKALAPSTTVESWACSSGWLSRWKVRHNIKFRSVCGENAAVDQEVCDDWKQRKLPPVLRRYDPSDVFNADETGLYLRLLPDKMHAIAGEVCTGGKKSKERVTVLVYANMSGSEKLPLLTIGKFKKPRCFRGVTCLPTADETGLYLRLLPDKMHAIAGEVCTGGKKSKERVTVLVYANMSGSEKLPLLTIGKFKKPWCFRGVTCLPTEYEANTSAWMTSVVFEEWLRKWDARLTQSKRKIALFVDNCTAHTHVQSLQSIELMFLPLNTTSEIQPCDQGIIKTLKVHYRKNMVKRRSPR